LINDDIKIIKLIQFQNQNVGIDLYKQENRIANLIFPQVKKYLTIVYDRLRLVILLDRICVND